MGRSIAEISKSKPTYWASKLTDKTGICWRAETKGLFFFYSILLVLPPQSFESLGLGFLADCLGKLHVQREADLSFRLQLEEKVLFTHATAASASPDLWQVIGVVEGDLGIAFFQLECVCFCPYRDLYRPLLTVQLSAVCETQLCSAGYFFLHFCRDRKIHPECKGLHLNWEFKLFWICLVRQPPTRKDSCYLLYRLLSLRVPEQISFPLAFIMASSMLLVLHIFGVCKYLQWYLGKYVCLYTL